MEKITTLFDRDWEGNRGVVPRFAVGPNFSGEVATEKLDGTNVRLTVRAGRLVRIEKRRNPSKRQKTLGIEEPWYTDTDEGEAADKWLVEAALNTDVSDAPEGEWSGEAIGPKIQGNPLGLKEHQVVLFSLIPPPLPECPPIDWADPEGTFALLSDYIRNAKSNLNPEVPIEGVVWHSPLGMTKLKAKDFK